MIRRSPVGDGRCNPTPLATDSLTVRAAAPGMNGAANFPHYGVHQQIHDIGDGSRKNPACAPINAPDTVDSVRRSLRTIRWVGATEAQ